VSIEDCERVSRTVDPVLDAADPIENAYYLSVSSLGLDRPLKKDADFKRNVGKRIEVRLYAPLNGKKEFVCELLSFDETSMTLRTDKGEMTLARKDVALARPELVF
jgi:ribosome maturation factor RimP